MVQFTVEEENLICMYHKTDRRRTAANIRAALPDMDEDMAALARQTADKLDAMHDADFEARQFHLHIHDELVAAAFASLPEQEQGILILHCVLGLADGEIGSLVGMSRSAVQRHRTKALNELRKRLEEERRKPK